MFIQRTIVEVYDNDVAKTSHASEILDRLSHDEYVLLRRNLKKRIKANDPQYLCDKCGTPLELSCTPDGHGSHEFFFRHFRDPEFDKCPIKTNTQRTEQEILRDQYAFKKESKPHIQLKKSVSEVIGKFIDADVIVDSKFIADRFGDSERRKPDIYFRHGGRELVIEFQINNTFHSVIEEREAFYERNGISLFWVFANFNPFEFQSISTKDIYVPNYNNAFVFDSYAEEESIKRETLCLRVFYKTYRAEAGQVVEQWMDELIQINDMVFDNKSHRPYFANCPELKQLAVNELEEQLNEKKQRAVEQAAAEKIDSFKNFLSILKKNDVIHNNWLYYLTNFSEYELSKLNETLKLINYQKDGYDLFQVLLRDDKHQNMVQFLLKARQLKIYVNSTNPETTLTTILQSNHTYKHTLAKALFLRGYRLSESDVDFIRKKEKGFDSDREIAKYRYYERVRTEGAMDLISDNLKELFVIQCAKDGKVELLGNGVQTPVWLANMAITQYVKYWPIFDHAFKKYDFYKQIFDSDTKHSFKAKLGKADQLEFASYPYFESLAKTLFPELRENPSYPLADM